MQTIKRFTTILFFALMAIMLASPASAAVTPLDVKSKAVGATTEIAAEMAAPAERDLEGPMLASGVHHCTVTAVAYTAGGYVYSAASAWCGFSHMGIVRVKEGSYVRAYDGWRNGSDFYASIYRSCTPGRTVYVQPYTAQFSVSGGSITAKGGGFNMTCR